MDVLKNKKSGKIFESVIFSIVGVICFVLSFSLEINASIIKTVI